MPESNTDSSLDQKIADLLDIDFDFSMFDTFNRFCEDKGFVAKGAVYARQHTFNPHIDYVSGTDSINMVFGEDGSTEEVFDFSYVEGMVRATHSALDAEKLFRKYRVLRSDHPYVRKISRLVLASRAEDGSFASVRIITIPSRHLYHAMSSLLKHSDLTQPSKLLEYI